MTDPELDFLKNLGANIDRYRREKKMTTLFLADKIGMSKTNLSPIINGKTNITALTFRKIGEALNVEPKKLI